MLAVHLPAVDRTVAANNQTCTELAELGQPTDAFKNAAESSTTMVVCRVDAEKLDAEIIAARDPKAFAQNFFRMRLADYNFGKVVGGAGAACSGKLKDPRSFFAGVFIGSVYTVVSDDLKSQKSLFDQQVAQAEQFFRRNELEASASSILRAYETLDRARRLHDNFLDNPMFPWGDDPIYPNVVTCGMEELSSQSVQPDAEVPVCDIPEASGWTALGAAVECQAERAADLLS